MISGLKEFELRRDDSYKYRQAGTQQPTHSSTSAPQRSTSLPAFHPAGLFLQDSSHSLTMKGHFSIEWMAQSSRPADSEKAPGPATCGTHSESLPGFYCRQQKFEEARGLDVFAQQQTSQSNQGKTFCKS